MGMYTEIFVKLTLVENVDESVVEILKYMMGEGDKPTKLPDHPLFKTSRWGSMLRCSSYYHIPGRGRYRVQRLSDGKVRHKETLEAAYKTIRRAN